MVGSMNQIRDRFIQVRKQLADKYKKKGYNKDQVQIKLNSINCEFFRGCWFNGKNPKKGTNEARIDFYLRILELELKEGK